MQRVSALLPTWDKHRKSADAKSGGASPLNRVFGWTDKHASLKVSAASASGAGPDAQPGSKVGREVYWPTTLDRECEKAARILKSFCTDGFLAHDHHESLDSVPASPTAPAAVQPATTAAIDTHQALKKIPPRIIQDAVGLAIFSCMRSGLWMSGSGGSGILIARKADGTWSPPAGILLHTAALGFLIGVDIYDCVLVINSVPALETFARARVTLGVDVNLTVGPLISAGLLENDLRWKELNNTVLTYLKARGQHRHVLLDGSLVTERGNENERFYEGSVGSIDVLDILAGNVSKSIPETTPLFEAIKAAEGRTDFDAATMELLSLHPAPGDAVIETPAASPATPNPAFGIPDADDPDPFGVIALEMAGLEIREAGTRLRPTSTQFEYNPSPASPVYGKFSRQSIETFATRSNRGSYMSARTQGTTMTDAYTQTDVNGTPDTTLSPSHSDDGKDQGLAENAPIPEEPRKEEEPVEVDYTKVDMSALRHLSQEALDETNSSSVTQTEETGHEAVAAPESHSQEATYPEDERDEDADDEDEDDEEEEPVVYEVATTTTQPVRASIVSTQVAQVIHAKGSLVTIPKRVPPPLPLRSPARVSRASKSDYGDVSMISSPLRQSFQPETKDEEEASDELKPEPEVVVVAAAADDDSAGHYQRKHSSSILTTVEKRMSLDSTTEIPETPQTTETTSSADESDRGPQTPRLAEDESRRESPRKASSDDGMKIEARHHIDANTIAVA